MAESNPTHLDSRGAVVLKMRGLDNQEKPARGYHRLYVERVTQAEQGCDFDFLAGK